MIVIQPLVFQNEVSFFINDVIVIIDLAMMLGAWYTEVECVVQTDVPRLVQTLRHLLKMKDEMDLFITARPI